MLAFNGIQITLNATHFNYHP